MKRICILALSLFAIACSVSTGKHTTKLTFNGGELLYTDSVTEAQAKTLGEYLVKTGFYDGKPKTVQLDKQDGIIHFAMVLADSLANSQEYQTMGNAFVAELEQAVFPGSTVELDYCDEYMKVKKNIKGNATAKQDGTTSATPVSENTGVNDDLFGYWQCTDITGGEQPDAVKAAQELETLKSNFTFHFKKDFTFQSNFINQANVSQPLDVQGAYQAIGGKISLHNLTINGQTANQEMQFDIVWDKETLQLISRGEGGKTDLVMSFGKTESE